MKPDMNRWIESAIAAETLRVMPAVTWPGLSLTGATVADAVRDGGVHAAAVVALARKWESAAATTIMDLSVEAEAFGAQVRFSDHEVPSVEGRLVKTDDHIQRLAVPSVDAARVPEYRRAVRIAAREITDRPVFAGCTGPLSLAGRLYGMTEIMTALMIEPGAIHELLEKLTRFLGALLRSYRDEGAGGVFMAEPAAGMVSSGMCEEFSSAYIKRIVDSVQDESFIVVLHNCGTTDELVESMVGTGAAAFHFGDSADMVQRLRVIPRDRCVMGNVSPVAMKLESPEQVRARVRDLLSAAASFPHFVLSTGCDVPPGTPVTTIDTLFETANAFAEGRGICART